MKEISVTETPPSTDTDAFRLYDGEEVEIDTFGGHWLVQTRDAAFPSELEGGESLWWKRLDKGKKEAPRRMKGHGPDEPFPVQEHGVKYEIDFRAGYSQGIFLDQRLNRQAVRERVTTGERVLNTFAYTCAFSVVAASAGATAMSVDLSKNYLEWGKRNFRLNGLEPGNHYFTKGDTFDWLRRWARSGTTFDGIVLDPPTFSRNDKGKVFRVEKNYAELVEAAARILNPGGWMLCCTNCRTVDEFRFEVMIHEGLDQAGSQANSLDFRSMPPEFTGEQYLKSVWLET